MQERRLQPVQETSIVKPLLVGGAIGYLFGKKK